MKIKGTHTAMKSGMLAADAAFEALSSLTSIAESEELDMSEPGIRIENYQKLVESSWIYQELKKVRNCHASFHKGLLPGLLYSGASAHVLKGRVRFSLHLPLYFIFSRNLGPYRIP